MVGVDELEEAEPLAERGVGGALGGVGEEDAVVQPAHHHLLDRVARALERLGRLVAPERVARDRLLRVAEEGLRELGELRDRPRLVGRRVPHERLERAR